MFDPLLWVLHYFITHYAGQTNQGNKNDDDSVDQVSGSKDAPKQDISLLQGSDTPNQNGASAPVDLQPEEKCKDEYWLLNLLNMCPQQQSSPELQPSISYDPSQSGEMPLPACFKMGILQYYTHFWKTKQYIEFTKMEAEYFESKYLFERKLGEGQSGMVFLATKKSDSMKVACKSIPDTKVDKYALESIPPPRCHFHNPPVCSKEPSAIQCIVHSKKPSVEQCMSSRPLDLMLPYEFLLQIYLSRPGHENPYVPKVFDYVVLKNEL
ncbi:hypothetical protein BASA83_005754 [Batrachochytrium salamandrivorans]|nr:hypothetical protein BASA83_005754 [Batrachochytrium salamandrivorans]